MQLLECLVHALRDLSYIDYDQQPEEVPPYARMVPILECVDEVGAGTFANVREAVTGRISTAPRPAL